MKFKQWLARNSIQQKLNRAQEDIAHQRGQAVSRQPQYSYRFFYSNLQIVNRAINMLVDDASQIKFKVGENISNITRVNVSFTKRTQLQNLLNYQANPFQDRNSFFRLVYLDLLLDGNAFIYFDGSHLYQLPARNVKIVPDQKTYIKQYEYKAGQQIFGPQQIIHIRDNGDNNSYRGSSRLRPALRTMRILKSMRDFQDNFFKNGAVPGLVLQVPDILSPRIKQKIAQQWSQQYKPQTGGRSPAILDGGKAISPISNSKFSDLDFQQGIQNAQYSILKSLGIPPILLDSGNNANIRPNHRLYYLQTIIPIIQKTKSAIQHYFGFEVSQDVAGIPALQPQLRQQAAYYSTLVNGGILGPNQARDALGLQPKQGHDDLRIPANIAGSAASPQQGGRPTNDEQ